MYRIFGNGPTLTCGELRSKREVELAARKVREELQQMGPVKYNEKTVLVHFILLVVLLLTRRPGFVTGWSALFSDDGYVRDGSVAVAVAISLFIFSNERPTVFCFRAKGDDRPLRSVPSLLIWKDVSKKFPWGVVFLIGGGSVLVDTVKVSGLSQSITPHMLALEPWPEWLICLFVIVTTCLTTELCSNTVITILILPVMRNLATVLKVHPLYIMLPAAVSTSMAFMLPVATPPNSLIYSYGSIKISDMMKAGSVMNLIAVCVIFLGIHTWGWYSFHLDTIPEWAWPSVNISTATNISVDPSSGPLTVTDIASLSNQTALLSLQSSLPHPARHTQKMKAGSVMNLIAVCVIFLGIHTWGWYFWITAAYAIYSK
ncbi:hypothetical protein RRG08_010734 [Elysia crispata]|uniref:Uncharacterized protein n=1 Tax=Elysia crispata TaxID=231223 RepID=A0AAE1CUL9_9GAST|nr:hypothetical protein RRG08_010734 [Elysia crispata]